MKDQSGILFAGEGLCYRNQILSTKPWPLDGIHPGQWALTYSVMNTNYKNVSPYVASFASPHKLIFYSHIRILSSFRLLIIFRLKILCVKKTTFSCASFQNREMNGNWPGRVLRTSVAIFGNVSKSIARRDCQNSFKNRKRSLIRKNTGVFVD